jgi:hypothetical protein
MSLHTLAHHLQSAGRGDDKVLVHMTPGEVSGLQSLAMAHGGSLTINPQTGLPEAGFLKKLLPTIAGIGLSFIPGVGPLMAAGIVGGGTALATGSLSKGLMAGLGAYGGAGLASGLSAAGAASQAATGAAAPSAANEALKQGIFSQAKSNIASTLPAAGGAANTGIMASGVSPIATTTLPAAAAPSISSTVASTAAPSMTSNMMAGVKSLGQEGGFGKLYDALPKGTLPALGGTLLAGMSSDQKGTGAPQEKSFIRPYTYERTQRPEAYDMGAPMYADKPGSSAEKNYFNESYTAQKPILAPGPEYAAEGGLMGYAAGGPIEQMAALNAVGANTGYPMAAVNTPMYSNPMMQRPEAVNVISPSGDAGVGAYSGEPRFAGGGETVGEYKYNYDPKTMQFTQTSAPTTKLSLSGRLGKALTPAFAQMTGQTMGSTPAFAQMTNQPITGAKVSGGIAPPAMGPAPAQPAMAAQPAYVPPAIPEYQSPEQQLGLGNFYGMMNQQLAGLQGLGGYDGYAAGGGISHLGDYSDGGRLLKGPGDGVSDSIPAVIGQRQPARLADGEFVIPARIVSELGNGSTEAGARKLYAMMDRVQKARGKTVGKGKVAANTRSERHLPA